MITEQACRKAIISIILCITLCAVFISCTTAVSVQQQTQIQRIPYRVITGTVFYPNNLYFPSRVRLEISLVASQVSSGQKTPIVTQIIKNPQRFPVNFILRYDPRDISRINEYLVVVELFREFENVPYLRNYDLSLPELTGDDNIVVELQEISNGATR